MTTDLEALLSRLVEARVDFVVIGGVALVLHGSSRVTQDLDLCYARNSENLDRLVEALAPIDPRLRGAPEGLPFVFDARTLASGLNFTLTTDLGDVDLLGDVLGVGGYEDLIDGAITMQLAGHSVAVMGLAGLERAKRATGRVKDLTDLEIIKAIQRERGR